MLAHTALFELSDVKSADAVCGYLKKITTKLAKYSDFPTI